MHLVDVAGEQKLPNDGNAAADSNALVFIAALFVVIFVLSLP
jgi:hypothetical protein